MTSESSPEKILVRAAEDRRRPARGWSRILVVLLGLFGLLVLCPAVTTLIRHPSLAPVSESLNLFAGMLFILVSICVAHNGRRMRMIGWISLTVLITGALLIWLLTATDTAKNMNTSIWINGGRDLIFLPLILPVVSGIWMWVSNPRRIVVTAELMENHLRQK